MRWTQRVTICNRKVLGDAKKGEITDKFPFVCIKFHTDRINAEAGTWINIQVQQKLQ
jgi:hypothetical protein